MNKFIIISIIALLFISCSTCLQESESSSSFESSHYIYSVISNTTTYKQRFFVLDVETSQVVTNDSLSITCSIQGIAKIEDIENSATFFCAQPYFGYYQVSLVTLDYQNGTTSQTYGFQTDLTTNQPMPFESFIFHNNQIFFAIQIEDGLSVINWDFNNNVETITGLKVENFNGLVFPEVGYDYSNGMMYVTYESASSPNACLLLFNPVNSSIAQTNYENIKNLNASEVKFLFSDASNDIYAVQADRNSTSVCKIDLQSLECTIVFAIGLDIDNELPVRYEEYFLNNDKSKLVVLTQNGIGKDKIHIVVFDIPTFSSTKYTIPDYWNSTSYSSYSFFNYI